MVSARGAVGVGAVLLALLVAGAGCAARRMPPLTPGLERYRFEVEVHHSPTGRRMFSGTAEVTDLATGHTIAAPEFIVKWGDTARVMTSDPETGVLLSIELTADAQGQGATYIATLRRGQEVLATNRADAKVVE